jgi:hypothetical protein
MQTDASGRFSGALAAAVTLGGACRAYEGVALDDASGSKVVGGREAATPSNAVIPSSDGTLGATWHRRPWD